MREIKEKLMMRIRNYIKNSKKPRNGGGRKTLVRSGPSMESGMNLNKNLYQLMSIFITSSLNGMAAPMNGGMHIRCIPEITLGKGGFTLIQTRY